MYVLPSCLSVDCSHNTELLTLTLEEFSHTYLISIQRSTDSSIPSAFACKVLDNAENSNFFLK